MPKSLHEAIEALAAQFASDLLATLRNASLEELSQVTSAARGNVRAGGLRSRGRGEGEGLTARGKQTKTGRLSRRSIEDIGEMVTSIVNLLDRHPEGLRAEQIRLALNVDPRELPRPLADALAARKISKAGQKRATTYFAKGQAPSGARAPAKSAKPKKRGAPKRVKRREENGTSEPGTGG